MCVCVYIYIYMYVYIIYIYIYIYIYIKSCFTPFQSFKKKLDHKSESFREQPGQKGPLSRKEEMVWITPHSLPPSSSSRHPICLPRPSPLTVPHSEDVEVRSIGIRLFHEGRASPLSSPFPPSIQHRAKYSLYVT